MKTDCINQNYEQNYHYIFSSDNNSADVVNSLYERIMRNDKQALEEVLKILGSNTYYLVYKRLSAYGMGSVENVDDLMQGIRLKIAQLAFRGFPGEVTEENFYGYLIGIVENSIKEYKKADGRRKRKEQYETEEYSVFDYLGESESNTLDNPEKVLLAKEQESFEQRILHSYEQALKNTNILPCRVLTYCYAILLPQLFKKSKNPAFLSKVEKLSSRKNKVANSTYNRECNCLEGEITRNSVILINWALDAMHKQKVSELSREFQDLYREEPLTKEESDFAWGAAYVDNMQSACNGKFMKDVVIPEDFQKLQIKNWPGRVAYALFLETEKYVQSDAGLRNKSIKLAELLVCR